MPTAPAEQSAPRAPTPPLSVAPMMQRTDRHLRTFLRHLSKRTLLYTEMVTTGALLHGDRRRHLTFDPFEKPVALQLGGDDPAALAECARIAVDYGYDEVNINVGCPSDRVQRGRFGACLMAHPEVVAEGVAAMRAAVDVPITVKHRIGIDDLDRYEHMLRFVDVVSAAGADRFSVHARKAWLQGLSPKENREIPPLRYADVYRLKRERPHLPIEINGGIRTLDATLEHLEYVDGVMIGRAAYETPMIFADADRRVFGEAVEPTDVFAALDAMVPYAARHIEAGNGGRLHHVTRHLLTVFQGIPGAKRWRRALAVAATAPEAGLSLFVDAIEEMRARAARAAAGAARDSAAHTVKNNTLDPTAPCPLTP